MKRGSTVFLKAILILIAIGALVGMIRFPLTEGRAANLDFISIYRDPLIIFLYISSIPFYLALYQAFTLLGYVEKNSVFTHVAVDAVKKIKNCSLATIVFLVGFILYIRIVAQGDESAGPTMVGFISIIVSGIFASTAGILQKLLQNAVDLKTENDFTV